MGADSDLLARRSRELGFTFTEVHASIELSVERLEARHSRPAPELVAIESEPSDAETLTARSVLEGWLRLAADIEADRQGVALERPRLTVIEGGRDA